MCCHSFEVKITAVKKDKKYLLFFLIGYAHGVLHLTVMADMALV